MHKANTIPSLGGLKQEPPPALLLALAEHSTEHSADISAANVTAGVQDHLTWLLQRIKEHHRDTNRHHERSIQHQLEEIQMRDKKPSQLLRQMRVLADTTAIGRLLRINWLRALPTRYRSILAILDLDELDKLAAVADILMEDDATQEDATMIIPSSSAPSIARTQAQSAFITLHDSLHRRPQVEHKEHGKELGHLFSAKEWTHQADTSVRSPSSQRPAGTAQLCFYHRRYGDHARKCAHPCSWHVGSCHVV